MHPRERSPKTVPLEERSRTIPLTSPLKSMPVYRPAPFLAVIAILLPVAAAGVASALLLDKNQQAPIWIPLLILLFIPLLTVAWLFMRSVRLTPMGISVGRPFQRWREAMWHQITYAERTGPFGMFIRIRTSGGGAISFAPRLLMDGGQLLGIVLDHLRPQYLDGALRMEALDRMSIPEDDITGMLRARPRNRWPLSGLSLSLVGIAGAGLAFGALSRPLAFIVAVVGALVAALGAAIALWMRQEVIVTSEGLTIIRPWRRSADEVMWDQVRVLDHSAHWALLRFRMEHSVRCIGPALLRAPERDRMLAFINRYCLQHGVLSFPHKGPF